MIIVIYMPSSIHKTILSYFIKQAIKMKNRLSRVAKREVKINFTESILSHLILLYLTKLAYILLKFIGFYNSNINISSIKELDRFVKLES